MKRFKLIHIVIIALIALPLMLSCSQKSDKHWGQKLEIDKKWWKVEGQSWNRETNVFMTTGYSNPNWTDKYDMRKSADLDARAQVASFMNSLVKNYSEEVRSHNFSISESVIEASAEEAVLGSVIVARKYRKKRYMSLIKVDLGYFFSGIYKKYRNDMSKRIEKQHRSANQTQLDEIIQEKVDNAMGNLKRLENPAIQKSLNETETKQ